MIQPIRHSANDLLEGDEIEDVPVDIEIAFDFETARYSESRYWVGARPMLPDGPPVLGRSGAEGIWLNLGHGSSGWALACGSAFALAQAMEGREAPIPLDGLGIERLR